MPRNNRRPPSPRDDDDSPDIANLLTGSRKIQERRNGSWHVQPISERRAERDYVCPGCTLAVAKGTAHVVVWRADGVTGDAGDLAGRRHWHTHCWRIGN